MIKLVDLTKIYNTGESIGIGIQGINLELNVGEFVAIVGSSGSGKTTLLNIVVLKYLKMIHYGMRTI